MKLSLQFHSVSETYSGLHDGGMKPADLRPILSKFVFNQSRRCFFHIFSFSSTGITLHVVCTRVTGDPGDYDAATVLIPCGVRVEGGKLATLINLLKEDIILDPSSRKAPSECSYARMFEDDHSSNEYPVLPDPKSDGTAYILYGNGQMHSSLVRLLVNLYRIPYTNFRDVVMIDVQEEVAPSPSAGLVNLSSSQIPSPNILFNIEISGGIPPSGILIDDEYVSELPVFVKGKFKLGFEHERFTFPGKNIDIPPDGIIRIREVDWDMKISRSDFHILDSANAAVTVCNIYINGRFLSNSLTLPISEASVAEVSIEADSCLSFRSRMDLTRTAPYEISLTNSKLSSKFYVGNNISFVLENNSGNRPESPLRGYRLNRTCSDSEYRLTFDFFSIFTNPLFYLSVILSFALGAFAAVRCLPYIESLRSDKASFIESSDGRPGVELFIDRQTNVSVDSSSQTVCADTLAHDNIILQ